eukprot:1056124-Pelagomonas_calceolata.AAC.1
MVSMSWWMAASKHACAPIMELSKAARFLPCCLPCALMTWIAWQKMCKGLLQALVTYKSHTCCMQMILCLTSNQPDQLQLMLDRLHVYAQRRGLVTNVAKSEIVHFNSRGDNVPIFTLGGARLACADSFKYLGMLFTKQRNLQASA